MFYKQIRYYHHDTRLRRQNMSIIISRIFDGKIKSDSILIEIPVEKYVEISRTIIDKNPFQRKRVGSSSTIYSLLKNDLKELCSIPPLVLATSRNFSEDELSSLTHDLLFSEQNFLILDGLQRTYTLIDAYNELKIDGSEKFEQFKLHPIRLEIFLNIQKEYMLYRMLTLNTGQTPMSMRHQIEILYSDFIEKGIDGITFVTELDEKRATLTSEYNFKESIEAFQSLVERDEFPMEKYDLLQVIKDIETIENSNKKNINLFEEFVKLHYDFVNILDALYSGWNYDNSISDVSSEFEIEQYPYGKTIIQIFKKSQTMTGFAAAIGKLMESSVLIDIKQAHDTLVNIQVQNIESLHLLLKRLDDTKSYAKKIGNAQRTFFKHFFLSFFDNEASGYLKIDESVNYAWKRFMRDYQ